MKFKVHLGGQTYNLHHGPQSYNVVGPSFYNFVPTTLAIDTTSPWTFSSITHTAADQHVDGWTEVEISNTWIQALDKPAISIDAEADVQYTTWGFIFGDDPEFECSPNIPDSNTFIGQITNNFFSGYPGFYCNLTQSGSTHFFELSQIMSPGHLLGYDSAFYGWLQNNMGTGVGLLDISMFDGILTFSSVNSPNTNILPLSSRGQSANLYFGWLPRDSVNNDGTYSYLVYLGYEMTSPSGYDVYASNVDSFFSYPEDVCLNLIYHQNLV